MARVSLTSDDMVAVAVARTRYARTIWPCLSGLISQGLWRVCAALHISAFLNCLQRIALCEASVYAELSTPATGILCVCWEKKRIRTAQQIVLARGLMDAIWQVWT